MNPLFQILGMFAVISWLMAGALFFRVQLVENRKKDLELKTAQQYADIATREYEHRLSSMFKERVQEKDKEIQWQEEQNDKEQKQQQAKKEQQEKQQEEQRLALILKNMEKSRKICVKSHEEVWWFSDCTSRDGEGNAIEGKVEPCEWKTWVCDKWRIRR